MNDTEKLKQWVCSLDKPSIDWMRYTFACIDRMIGTEDACKDLPLLISNKVGKDVKEVRFERNVFRCKNNLPWARCQNINLTEEEQYRLIESIKGRGLCAIKKHL